MPHSSHYAGVGTSTGSSGGGGVAAEPLAYCQYDVSPADLPQTIGTNRQLFAATGSVLVIDPNNEITPSRFKASPTLNPGLWFIRTNLTTQTTDGNSQARGVSLRIRTIRGVRVLAESGTIYIKGRLVQSGINAVVSFNLTEATQIAIDIITKSNQKSCLLYTSPSPRDS